jgi:tRNA(Ile)-lysidine synthase TilS/MesJ
MIALPVDEGYAFDYLSILELKYRKDPCNKAKRRGYYECRKHIRTQLRRGLFARIIKSQLYLAMQQANTDTFGAVDRAKTDSVPASLVDRCNYRRYLCKVALQREFFGTGLVELKVGYENR